MEEGMRVRDRVSWEPGEVDQVYHDGWLRVRMEDGTFRYFEPRDLELDPDYKEGTRQLLGKSC